MTLAEYNHLGVGTRVEEEGCGSLPVTVEGLLDWGKEVGMKGQEVLEVVESGGKVGLQGRAFSGEEVCNITRHSATAWQSAGSASVCPVTPKPARPVSS